METSNLPLQSFFVVTLNSLYVVQVSPGKPFSHEGFYRRISKNPKVNSIVYGPGYVCITGYKGLIGHWYRLREDPSQVSSKYHYGNTSPITALFTNEDPARECLSVTDRQPWDERWHEDTRQVLEQIGPDHPCFIISPWMRNTSTSRLEWYDRYFSLLPETVARQIL